MAVDSLHEPVPEAGVDARLSWSEWAGVLHGLAASPLPSDMNGEEYSEEVLFRASMLLNFLTGGTQHMTFSARAYYARSQAQYTGGKLFWYGISCTIDAACGALRGETDHCHAAWVNHLARGNDLQS